MLRAPSLLSLGLPLLAALAPSIVACRDDRDQPGSPPAEQGQTEFESVLPYGLGDGTSTFGDDDARPSTLLETQEPPEGTDIYRVDGDRLYFLSSYRGLLVFDIGTVDDPKLLGRSPVYGAPVGMFVQGGIVTVVIGDWYGNASDGSPFHGSVVRTIDVRDPAHMKVEGEVQLTGWARDMRVVGDNLLIVSEDFGWRYGDWVDGLGSPPDFRNVPKKIILSSVRFGEPAPRLSDTKEFATNGGAFHVTANAVLMAHRKWDKSAVEYLALSQLDGSMVSKGTIEVDGDLRGFGASNGDGTTASILTSGATQVDTRRLTTLDFSDPAAPKTLGVRDIAATGTETLFSDKRMYLSRSGLQSATFDVYDLSTPATPELTGSTSVSGSGVRLLPLSADRLFSLATEADGNEYRLLLHMLDVADATAPKGLGTSTFSYPVRWSPALHTYKALTHDEAQKLVALPFTLESEASVVRTSGVQLIEYDNDSMTTKGATTLKGRVERGVFVKDRLISLSAQALSVIDYADRNNLKIVKELTLAPNVVSAGPNNATIAQMSIDWGRHEKEKSELRVAPIASAQEIAHEPSARTLALNGSDARVFRNGDLAYVVTMLYPKPRTYSPSPVTPHVQVVDLAGGNIVSKGAIDLPQEANLVTRQWWNGSAWYEEASAVQVGGSALAFRRGSESYDPATNTSRLDQKLYLVDLADPNAPKLASTTITPDVDSWWGNMRVVGNTLYAGHCEWTTKPNLGRYYLDSIDLTDRANPKVGQRVNVPGILVGASETDPSLLYFLDYRPGDAPSDDRQALAIVKMNDGKAYLQSSMLIDGWVDNVFVRGNKAYASVMPPSFGPTSPELHEFDLSNPKAPVERRLIQHGLGWLVDVEGDRAILRSGWGEVGLDIYKLVPNQAPTYSQFVRTSGFGRSSIASHGSDLFVSSGFWGLQRVSLQ